MNTFMFDGFIRRQIKTQETTINLVRGGSGYPILLLHGYPQTHVCWHRVSPILAEQLQLSALTFVVLATVNKPPSDPEHLAYSKRVMAQDQD